MEFQQAFAESIREERKRQKLSQEALAGKVESNQRYISEIESCQKNPTLKFCHQLAIALEMPLSELVQHAEQKLSK